jgi:hypothetical protein
MGDGLCIRGDAVVHFTGEVNMCGTEAGEDVVDEFKAFVRGTMLDEDLYHVVLQTDVRADGQPSKGRVIPEAGLVCSL